MFQNLTSDWFNNFNIWFVSQISPENIPFTLSIITIIHYILATFLIIGCLLPKKFLKYHIGLVAITIIHWYTNNNNCFSTQIENKLGKNTENFMIDYYKTFLGIDFSNEQSDRLTYFIYGFSIVVSIVRLYLY